MVCDACLIVWWLARFPGLVSQVLGSQVNSTLIIDLDEREFAGILGPGVRARFVWAVGVIEQLQLAACHSIRADGGEAGYLVVHSEDALVHHQAPITSGKLEVGATRAAPPLRLARVQFAIHAVDFCARGWR